jgi:putative heme-binding domain-containing protein
VKRNSDLPVTTVTEEMSDHGVPAKVFPIVANTRFEMLTNVGEFTSACGLTLWRGGAFVAEPAHNLVHRDVYSASGATFKASRDREAVEFLASRDPWFRPVNFYAAPDGSMYMLDFYRLVIEHPEWMSTEAFKATRDLTAGIDRGRIYRITQGSVSAAKPVRLSAASTAELVQHLASENPWWRRTAQRLLVDRKTADAAPLSAAMAASHSSPVARVHALWTLQGLGKLETPAIEAALGDTSAGVRENAIKLAEPLLRNTPALVTRLVAMNGDPDPRVRFQLLCTLGFVATPAARRVRDQLLAADLNDRWVQIAALSASPEEAIRLLPLATRAGSPPSFARQVAAVIGARHRPAEVQMLLASGNAAALEGLAEGMRGKDAQLSSAHKQQLIRMFEHRDPAVRRAALHVLQIAGVDAAPLATAAARRAEIVAVNNKADADSRADSIAFLALVDPAQRRSVFERLLSPAEPEAVQIAAARALGRITGEETGRYLLKGWRGFTSNVRMEAADALYRDPNRIPMVVAALKNGGIQPWTLAFRHKRQLVMHRDPAIRDAVRPLLESTQGDRAKVVAQYQKALELPGDSSRGAIVFENVCAKCHKLNGKGADVGPDLGTVRHQTKQVLLTAILEPSQSISQGFEAYVVELNSGATVDGVLGPQTATTIALKHEEGKQDVIQRNDIKSIYGTNLSAMPADLEKQISVQQMSDLLEFIKSNR